MKKLYSLLVILFCVILSPRVTGLSTALPLYTNSRWIVDEGGQRVKLACVNWASHLDAMVAQGLSKQPLDVISKRIVSMGFDCVRLTWPLFMLTNDSLALVTIRQSFQSLGLLESIAGIQFNNPSMVDLPLIQAYKVVVSNLADNNVMVILDNYISKPGWCCSNFKGSGFFGDRHFDSDLWLKGLAGVATMFNGKANVVGMSLINDLQGSKQNVKDWYRYMLKGAEAVHAANPDILVLLSGLNYDTDFTFLIKQPVNLTFSGKLVFEVHWYKFPDSKARKTGLRNQVCESVVNNLMRKAGLLLEQGWPLFLSEFGADRISDNVFLNCLFGAAAELDWDLAMWTLVGSNYLREGVMGMEQTYGLLRWDWHGIRNSSFVQRLSSLQTPFQAQGLSGARAYKIIFHPSTGLCVLRKSQMEPLKLGSCSESEAWSYTPQKTLVVKGTYFCLQATGLGKPAKLGIICTDPGSKWEVISDSKMHLSTNLANGTTVCLDVDSSNAIITNPCKCSSRDQTCDPGSQWFKIADSTRSSTTARLPVQICLRMTNFNWTSLELNMRKGALNEAHKHTDLKISFFIC